MTLTNQEITEKIAIDLITLPIGSKLPTFDEFEAKFDASRGTLQRILNDFKYSEAITLRSRGYKGTFIVDKNIEQLLKIAGIDHIFGSFPIPYSKSIYESCLDVDQKLKESLSLSVSISTFSTGKDRINDLLEGRTNFIMVSKYVGEHLIKTGMPFEIVCDLGPGSFGTEPVLLFGQDKELEITDGIKVGIDSNLVELVDAVQNYLKDYDIEYVDLEYNQFQNEMAKGTIDAAFVIRDDFNLPNHYIQIDHESNLYKRLEVMNIGVILTNTNQPYINELIRNILND